MATIKVKIEFNQVLPNGETQLVSRFEEREFSDATLESMDDCELAVLSTAYSAMREGVSARMEQTSKKKANLKERKDK